jgi:hypothetical protein
VELSNVMAGNAYMVRQAISLAMLQKTMGLDANVISELMPDAMSASAEALEVPSDPSLGGNIDISI